MSAQDTLRQLTTQPVWTLPNTTDYEWAGATLRRLLGMNQPVAEIWPFFSGSQRPATSKNLAPASGNTVTMEQLVRLCPEVLGPDGADPDNDHQKYFFVKFLDPSDFPPFAYVGFNPDVISKQDLSSTAFAAWFTDLLWQERQTLEQFTACIQPHCTTLEQFLSFRNAYKQWAIQQAAANWTAKSMVDVSLILPLSQRAPALEVLARQQAIRQQITDVLHRIDFEDDQAILIESPTLHAIAGLSLQLHPRTQGNFYPKDELWIYKSLYDAAGTRLGWILVEPQRTFDKTESGADFFTPWAWRNGRMEFRKQLPAGYADWKTYLQDFVALMDATPRPRTHYVRRAQRVPLPTGSLKGQAQWYRTVEEESWPYFFVRELRFSGPGEATTPLAHESFSELHMTRGSLEITLTSTKQGRPLTFTVNPTQPVFLPATLPFDTITYRATAPADLLFFSRSTR